MTAQQVVGTLIGFRIVMNPDQPTSREVECFSDEAAKACNTMTKDDPEVKEIKAFELIQVEGNEEVFAQTIRHMPDAPIGEKRYEWICKVCGDSNFKQTPQDNAKYICWSCSYID